MNSQATSTIDVSTGQKAGFLPVEQTQAAILKFTKWLEDYGETSYDFQSFYASSLGQRAKALYYQKPLLGLFAVAPMVFSEAFVPSARSIFWKRQRFPIADAHYAMGFALLAKLTGEERHYQKALHFLQVLKSTRCSGYSHYCWGYPFNWETLRGTIREGTPLITTVPYVYEAFRQVWEIDRADEFVGPIYFPNLSKGLVNVRYGSYERSSFPDRSAERFPIEWISPTIVAVAGTSSALEDLKKVKRLLVVTSFSRQLSQECKSHRIVSIGYRKSLALPKYTPREGHKCLGEYHWSYRK